MNEATTLTRADQIRLAPAMGVFERYLTLFAPIVALLLGLSSITAQWNTLLLSVVLYIVVPVIVAQLWRRALLAQGGQDALQKTLARLGPLSLSRCC